MKISELEEQQREFNIMQNKSEITKVLSARGLDTRFVDLIAHMYAVDNAK